LLFFLPGLEIDATYGQAGLQFRSQEFGAEMRWIVAQIGARQHYALPLSFYRLGHLRLFCTEAWCRWGQRLVRAGPGIMRAFANRYHPELPPSKVLSFTSSQAALYLRHFPGRSASVSAVHRYYLKQGVWFGTRVARHLSALTLVPGEDYFFTFNTGALEPLRAMRERGVFTVLDQIDAGREHERLVSLERERWPGWEDAVDPIPEEYWSRISEEWEAADIIMVNSEWSKSLLICQGVPEQKLITVPLAYHAPRDLCIEKAVGSQLTVLWLGNVILSKGIQYLVEAAKMLPLVRFVVAGPIGIREGKVRSAPANMAFLGRIQRHKTDRLFQEAHLFVLPTISDGFAITQLEAMAHGLPVITTPNCGRVVTDKVDGLVVPARDSEALAAAIARLDANRNELLKMSRAAAEKADTFKLPRNAEEIEENVKAAISRRSAICGTGARS
jgi:glycosyltransferase involved in cell wall biosynthesis